MRRMGMLVDTTKCMGCRACQIACKEWNDLPATNTMNRGSYENPTDLSASNWMFVDFYEVLDDTSVKWLFLKRACLHCTEAACVDVCPTRALQHHDKGFISLEEVRCNDCGYCVEVCPFQVPRLRTDKLTGQGKATKCTLCQDRVTNGLIPARAKTCPAHAIRFGERSEILHLASKRVAELKSAGGSQASLYGEHELGGLGCMYVLAESHTQALSPHRQAGTSAKAHQGTAS